VRRLLKNPLFFTLLFSLTLFLGTIPSIHASPAVEVIVTTDKQAYNPGKVVLIYGNLTFGETLVTDGLVGIQVQDSEDALLIIRTVTTGTIPLTTPYVEVWPIVPCNSEGSPKESFKRGTLAYFNISATNHDIKPRLALMTVNTYDPNNVPFCSASIKTTLDGRTTSTFIISIPIPIDATTGNATAYANAYTDWPKLEGTPYCPEESATFKITDGSSQATTLTTQSQPIATPQTDENYNTTFQLAPLAKAGKYTIYVTSRYMGEEAFNSTTFKVSLLGDFDGDFDVNINDIRYFCSAYINYWSIPSIKDELGDFDHDCDIDIDDIRTFSTAYIQNWS